MLTLNPMQGLLGRVLTAAASPTSTVVDISTVPVLSPQRPLAFQNQRSSFSTSLALAASLCLFGSMPLLSGCGRTGLLTPESDTVEDGDAGSPPRDAGVEPHDAGAGGDSGMHDAGSPDAGTINPAFISDLDCDGIPDLLDNCFQSSNTNQADTDGDGLGDVCDNDSLNPDLDGDGLLDGFELYGIGINPTALDTDGDGLPDGTDTCPTTAGTAANQGCQATPPTCSIEAYPLPKTLCDGTMVEGFRILWTTGNTANASLREGSLELTQRFSGQIYVYPADSRTYEISAQSPFGSCADSVTVTP